MAWSYAEDILLIVSNKTALELEKEMNRSAQSIRFRRFQLKNVNVTNLLDEENYIITNYAKKSVTEMAMELNVSHTTLSRRIKLMKNEGTLSSGPKPVVHPSRSRIEPQHVPKKMFASVSVAPKEALRKVDVQRDVLEVGACYIITKGIRKIKLKVIGCYNDHYLLEKNNGMKYSLSKVDYHLGVWTFKILEEAQYECNV